MHELNISVNGVNFENPFLIGSGPSTASRELMIRAFEAGWGGIVTKTLVLNSSIIRNVTPRVIGVSQKNNPNYGLVNIELTSERKIIEWESDISYLKKNYPNKIVIGSIMADANNKEHWQEITKRISDAGADIIELNLSCPHGMPEFGMGSAVGQNPDLVEKVTSWVREVCKIPLWVKLTPNVTNIVVPGQRVKESGGDCLVAINSINSIAGVNLETLIPSPSVFNKGAFGGYSGAAIKPIALRSVAELAQGVNLPISGVGGISDAKDAIEFLLLGASTVQICTAIMFHGFNIINSLKSGLTEFMDLHGFKDLESFIGKSLTYLSPVDKLDRKKLRAKIDNSICNNCRKCLTSCRDSANGAIYENVERKIKIDPNLCIGCGLCQQVCSSKDCISLF